MADGNLHKGHRERLKQQFLDVGLDSFQEHQILELLLFYSIPQKDTNDIAHELINHFGSLSEVFNASYEALLSVKGIKHHSAVLIKMIPQLFRQYQKSAVSKPELHKTELTKEYLLTEYEKFVAANLTAYDEEVFIVICLDNSNRIKKSSLISKGCASETQVNPRDIVEFALRHNATNLIVAHNHPGGIPIPSPQDKMFTKYLVQLLAELKINLRDHIIFSGTDSSSLETSTFSMANHPSFGEIFEANFSNVKNQ